uniref:lysophospholipid acyltransferase family protein n=1 Tax=Chitinimonas sp. TaxID=1934313 RepID=UPI0035B3F07F
MSKHQSAWETMALQSMLPLTAWVVKRELLWIPFFGWGMWSLRPIALNRANAQLASRQLLQQGGERLKAGAWIVIFPEGTRVAAGKRGKYKQGGARLACDAGVPVVPVAVNSGEFWPRNSFLKYPGEMTLSIGKPISTAGKSAAEVSREVENWIEAEMVRISGVGPMWPANKQPEDVHGPLVA